MGINTPRVASAFDETPSGTNHDLSAPSLNFSRLPKPKNDFEIIVPEKEDHVDALDGIEEDMADVQVRIKRVAEKELEAALKRRSQVVQRNVYFYYFYSR